MRRDLENLAGLRGFAALAVVIYHATMGPLNGFEGRPVVQHGWMAVDLFFVLSGLVLSYAYGRDFAHGVSYSKYAEFAWRRIARLYPAYWAITVAYLIKYVIDYKRNQAFLSSLDGFDYIGNVFMLTAWPLNVTPIVGVSWSVSAELVAYVFFPLITLAVHRSSAPRIFAAILGLVSLLLIGAVAHSGRGVNGSLDVVDIGSLWPIIRCLGGFCLGIALYQIADEPKVRRFFDDPITSWIMIAGFLGSVVFIVSDLTIYGWIPFIILWLYGESDVAAHVFGNPLARWLGSISYSLYLLHTLVLSPTLKITQIMAPVVGGTPAFYIAAGSLILLCLFVAHLCYRFIEIPGRRLLTKLADRFKPRNKPTVQPSIG